MKQSRVSQTTIKQYSKLKTDCQNVVSQSTSPKFVKLSNLFMAFIFLMTTSVLFSCASKPKTVATSTLISYTKEKSRGDRLPRYSIEFLDNKTVKYTGLANVPVLSEKMIDLDTKKFDAIVKEFKATNFSDFKTMYKGNKRDLPLTSITYDTHKVTYQQEACPKQLSKLSEMIEALVPSE